MAQAKPKLPFVSVIIPAYNEEKYLGTALDSILQQDFPRNRFEIIVADNKSTDATPKIARAHGAKVVNASKVPPFHVGAVRHEGALAASRRAEVLVFADADIHAPPNWLRTLVSAYEDGRVAGAQGPVLPSDGTLFQTLVSKMLFVPYLGVMALLKHPSGPGSNYSARRVAYFKVKGFNKNLITCEDIDLAARLLKIGRFVFVARAPVNVSMRRVQKWGTVKYFLFHVINSVRYALFGKSSEEYEPIR
ncbi:MAG: glycosyltransferase [Candidatus Micrarchaeota archaeon]